MSKYIKWSDDSEMWDLEIGTRAIRLLQENGVDSVEKIRDLSAKEILSWKGAAVKTLHEISRAVADLPNGLMCDLWRDDPRIYGPHRPDEGSSTVMSLLFDRSPETFNRWARMGLLPAGIRADIKGVDRPSGKKHIFILSTGTL